MKVGKPSLKQYPRRPAWPEAVQILSRRKLLSRNYQCLVGELRSHRRAATVFSRDPSPSARALVSVHRRRLDASIGKYMRTLAELRGAVEVVFPPGRSGLGLRRPPKRLRR
jgi:hypothetical protein